MRYTEAIQSNRKLWDEWTNIHEHSKMYDLAGFRAGNRRLHALEISELGDVSGKTLLHLQCHFGLDTLSWADRGAIVTGVDFSENAIALAKSIATDTGIPAEFVLSDIMELQGKIDQRFDIVFTSYGAIYWLPDIRKWAEVIVGHLKPGGTFYMAEFHPFGYVFDDRAGVKSLVPHYPYFNGVEPQLYPVEGSYADKSAFVSVEVEHSWAHTIGDVVSALAESGLRIEFLHEHPFTVFQQTDWVSLSGDGYFHIIEPNISIPLIYSIKATKPA